MKSFSTASVHKKKVGIAILARSVSGIEQFPLVDIPEILRSFRKEHGVDAKVLNINNAREAAQETRKELGSITFPIGIIAFDNARKLGNNVVFSNNGISLSISVPIKYQGKEASPPNASG